MKQFVLASVAVGSLALSACATDPYGRPYDPQARGAITGAAVGAGAGAVGGAVIGGISPVEGALVGAVLGGVAGAIINNKQYYRDTRGYCYYVDQHGNPVYDYNVRC
ncbi:MAG TPA: YMGG-like glycine zipper-containing protein [Sphingomicrobium sp.]|nr:YMGG-like glycine zipper-containing protein [Sphingomicrobium sp.]